jgi:hypothetical protein
MQCMKLDDSVVCNFSEISGSHGDKYEDTVFWDVALCSLVVID